MNQSTSKALRKAIGFKVHKPRKYTANTVRNNLGGIAVIVTADNNRRAYQEAKKEYLERKRK